MKKIKLINLENVSDAEVKKYKIRKTTRAVAVDENGLVALLRAKKNYYSLPGGGIKKWETAKNAMKRECLEEIGCRVKILKKLGIVTENRKKLNMVQKSYCYIAKVKGEKGTPALEAHEIDECAEIVWTTIDDAIRKIEEGRSENPYITERNIFLLNLTANYLK